MRFLFLLISTSYSLAFAGPAVTSSQGLLHHTVAQDGPNCFNTSLVVQGFTQDIVFNSDLELKFYVQNFCKPQSASAPLKPRDLIVFTNRDNKEAIHSAVVIRGNEIIEKNSLYGIQTPAMPEDSQPGRYLQRDISQSVYSDRQAQELFGTTYNQKAYSCVTPQAIATGLQSLQKNPAVQEQLQFRKELAKAVNISERKKLEEKILNELVPMMKSMKWSKASIKNSQEVQYLQALLRSNAYQMHLLNCSESMKTQGECWVPQLKASTTQTDLWFDQIIQFESKYKLK